MPLLGKKCFKPSPLPKDLKSEEEIFVIKETNEVFRSYEYPFVICKKRAPHFIFDSVLPASMRFGSVAAWVNAPLVHCQMQTWIGYLSLSKIRVTTPKFLLTYLSTRTSTKSIHGTRNHRLHVIGF